LRPVLAQAFSLVGPYLVDRYGIDYARYEVCLPGLRLVRTTRLRAAA